MGYNRTQPDGKSQSFTASNIETSPGGPIDWTFQNTVPVQINNAPTTDTLRIGVNALYVKNILRALQSPQNNTLTLTFIGPTRPILFTPLAHKDWLALLMPLRIETLEPTS